MNRKSSAKKKPRYIEIADELRTAVLCGDYSDRSNFPSESNLCEVFDVSRFTVREALRKLADEGLITRKRGSGTLVQPATARAGAMHQPLSNVGEILQYAHGTTIAFEKQGIEAIPNFIAQQITSNTDGEWFAFRGKRMTPAKEQPIALTKAWVHPDLADVVSQIDLSATAIFTQIESIGKVSVSRVTQNIQAINATKDIITDLGLEKDDPVLRIIRYYFDENDRMLEVSANYHPGVHFVYSMHIEAD